MRARTLALWGTLLATLAATWWTSIIDEEEPSAPVARREAGARTAAPQAAAPETAAAGEDALEIRREPWPAWAAGIFRPMESGPPGEPTSAEAPPAGPPAAPPLPFRYVGTLEEPGRRAVILLEGDAMHIRRAGERIDDRYRVERISPTEIEFTHLPSKQRQVLVTSLHEQYR